jgi:enoyl-CoA hydratase/carnithine racemase
MSDRTLIDLDRTDGVATITFDRPDSLNAVNLELQRDFHDALEELADDPADGLVLQGRGDATCAGMDQDLVTDPDYHEKYHEEIIERNDAIYDHLLSYPGPTAMAGKGAVVGVGFGISLRVDFVILGEETHLSLPEIQYGIDTSGSVSRIAKLVGVRAAREIAMTGDPIEPERALNLGLVNDVVHEEAVDETTREFVSRLTEYDTDILTDIKRAVSIEE